MIYNFDAGAGQSVIDNISAEDTIQIEVLNAELTYTRNGNDLVIKYTDTDTVTVTNYFDGESNIESTTAFHDIKVKTGEEEYSDYNLFEQTINVSVDGDFRAPNITTDSVITGGFKENITSAGSTTGDGYKVYGNQGNDTLRGSDAEDKVGDWLEGGEGDDTLYAGSSATIVRESEAGTSKDYPYNMLAGNMGHDIIYGSEGTDRIYGGDAGVDDIGDEMYGYGGNDVIKGAEGDDTIVGGTGDDELWGRGGNDIFVYEIGDGHDTIKDAANGDIIQIETVGASFQKVQQFGENLVLTFDENNSITIENFNYADTTGNIDTIKIKTTEDYDTLSIYADLKFTKELTNEEVYTKVTPYHEEISLADGATTATVSGMTSDDKIVVDGEPIYSRVNEGGLVINDAITVSDFVWDGAHNINVNDGSTSGMTVNVTLTNALETPYACTSYNEIISGTGTVTGMTSDDKIVVDGNPMYSRVNAGGLVINDAITVSDFVWDGAHNINVNDGSTSGMTVNVTLTNALETPYACTGYNEIFTGVGTVSGITKYDNIDIQNAEYYRNGAANVLRVTDGINDISVNGFIYTAVNKTVKVDGILVDYSDTINVNLNNETCTATNYTEIFTGSGSISGLDDDDKIIFTSETTYTQNTNGLEIKDSTNTVTVVDYEEGEEPVVEVEGVRDTVANKVLYVEGLTEFDGTNTNFKNVCIKGTSSADTLIGSTKNDIIEGTAGNDTLTGNGGDDVFIYRIGDGHDTIEDAVLGDIIQIEDNIETLPKFQFIVTEGENSMGMLIGDVVITFDENNSITVKNFDYAHTTSNFDTIKINRGDDNYQTLSLKTDIIFTKELTDGEFYTKTTPYNEKISLADGALTAAVEGLTANDKVYVETSPVFSRTNNGGLILNDSLTISDFFEQNRDFDIYYGEGNSHVNTSSATINVKLKSDFSYTTTKYNEIISGKGSVTSTYATSNYTINFENAKLYRTNDDNVLRVSDGNANNISVMNYIFSTQNTVKVNDVFVTFADTINVELTNDEGYEATRYTEDFTGSGNVSKLSSEDNISIANGKLYRNGTDRILTVSDGTSTINVTDFDFTTENAMKVNGNLVSFDTTINVNLNNESDYSATDYSEAFYGKGSIDGSTLTDKDCILVESYKLYRTDNDENLRISDGADNDIVISGYDFSAENTTVYVNEHKIDFTDTLNVTLNDTTYTTTDYYEVISGSGNVSELTADDKLSFASTTTYTQNENGLVITDGTNTITVTDYNTGEEPVVEVGGIEDAVENKVLYVEGLTSFDGTDTRFANVEITGTSGTDTYKGSTANDIITGAEGNDTLTGNGGNDVFVYHVGDGKDVITDANAGDILQIDTILENMPTIEYVSGEEESNGNLVITFDENNSVTVENFDYYYEEETCPNFDIIMIKTEEGYNTISLSADVRFKKELTDGENYSKTTPYHEEISLADGADTATVRGVDVNDNIVVTDTPVFFSRINEGCLIINDAIFVADFTWDGYNNIRVNDETTADMTVNVTLTEELETPYNCTGYKESFTGVGILDGKTISYEDNINIENAILSRKGMGTTLTVHDNSNTNVIGISEYDYTTENTIKVGGELVTFETVINVDLNSEECTATDYSEIFTGAGSISGMSSNDKIVVEGEPIYSRINDGNLTINNAIIVTDFNWNGGSDINVNDGTTEGMTVNVELVKDYEHSQEYICTAYSEAFTGEGIINGETITADDYINIDNATFYRNGSESILQIKGGDNNIRISNFDFNTENETLYVKEHLVSYSDVINVSIDEEEYAATEYSEVITGSGSVSGMKNTDKIVVEGEPVYSRINEGNLVINDVITVSDFIWDGEHDINVNNGSTAGMTVNVTLTEELETPYKNTRYNEVFTGVGTISSGITASDNIDIENAVFYRTGTENVLRITGGNNDISVNGFVFSAENTTVRVHGELVNYENTINVNLNGVNNYVGTEYSEVFTGSGSVSGLKANDKISMDDYQLYRTGNEGVLEISNGNNTVRVTDFVFTSENETVYVNEHKISYTDTLNVSLTGGEETYLATNYNEVLRGSGNVSGLTNNDKIVFESATTYTQKTTGLEIKDNTNTVTVVDYTAGSEPVVYVGSVEDIVGNKILYVEGLTEFDGTGTNFASVNIAGTSDADTLKGSTANDIIRGNGGADTLTGNGGNDVFVYSVTDGHDTITDANRGDILRIDSVISEQPKAKYVDGNLVLIFDENNSVTIENFNYANPSGNINTLEFKRQDGGYDTVEIFDGVLFTRELTGNGYTKTTPYHEIVMLAEGVESDTVSGLDANDKIVVSGSPVYSRVNEGGLIINNAITVSDFAWDGTNNLRVNNGTTEGMTVNVYLNEELKTPYNCTIYNEILSGVGSVSGVTTFDNINIKNARFDRLGTDTTLQITGGDNNINIVNYDFSKQNIIKVDNTILDFEHTTIYVDLNNENCTATEYCEIFSGTGLVSGMNDRDMILVEGEPVYSRTNEGALVISGTITVSDFIWDGDHNINVNYGGTDNMTVNVTLTEALDHPYTCTGYKEIIKGVGSVYALGLTPNDNIKFDDAALYRKGMENVLEIKGGDNDIKVVDYDFEQTNTNVYVNGNRVAFENTLNVDLNGIACTATNYHEIFTGSGSIAGMNYFDKIVVDGEPVYSRTNEGALVINDIITVRDFDWEGGHDINVNDGSTLGMTVNVTLTQDFEDTYICTDYTEVISGVGSVARITANDTINIDNATYYRTGNDNILEIKGGDNDIKVTGFYFTDENTKVYVKDHLVNTSDTITVNLNDVTDYAGTDYIEVFTGSGTLSGMNTNLDKVVVQGTPTFRRIDNGGLIIEGSDGKQIIVEDFDWTGAHDIMVNDITTEGMTVYRTITKEDQYIEPSAYKEVFTGRGTVDASTGEQIDLIITGVVRYKRTGNENIMTVLNEDESQGYNVLNFDFKNGMSNVSVNGKTIDDSITLEVELNQEEYTASRFHEVFKETSGRITGITSDANIIMQNGQLFRRGNETDLLISDGINNLYITNFSYDEENTAVKLNDRVIKYNNCTINVDLNGEEYASTGYKELFTGSGTLTEITEGDEIVMDGTPVFTRLNNGKLVIKNSLSGDTINVPDFFENGQDIIVNGTSTAEMTLDVTLRNYFTYTATRYNENFSGFGSITGISANDNVDIQQAIFSRTADDNTLKIYNNTNTINIIDYDFDSQNILKVNNELVTFDNTTINVDLNGVKDFTATNYAEIFTGRGSLSGMTTADEIIVDDTPAYTRRNAGGLTINNVITVNDFNWDDEEYYIRVNGGDTRNMVVTVLLSTDYTEVFQATHYEEHFKGSGTINGNTLTEEDNIIIAGITEQKFHRKGNENTLTITNGTDTINVINYNFTTENTHIKVDNNLVEFKDIINVDLNGETYAATKYNEVFSGSGELTGLTTDDKLFFNAETKYSLFATETGTTLSITDGTNTINITDYDWDVTHPDRIDPIVVVNGIVDNIENKVLYISGLSFFDGTKTNFGAINITGTDDNDMFTDTTGDDVINPSGGTVDVYNIQPQNGSDVVIENEDADLVKLMFKDSTKLSFSSTGTDDDLTITHEYDDLSGNLYKGNVTLKDYIAGKYPNLEVSNIEGHAYPETTNLYAYLTDPDGEPVVAVGNPNSPYNQVIHGCEFNEILQGGYGNDTIYTEGGNDLVKGGRGNDNIISTAGKGRKVFEFNRMDGIDAVYNADNDDRTVIKGVNMSEATYTKSGNNLLVTYRTSKKDGTDRIIFADYLAQDKTRNNSMRYIDFADGTYDIFAHPLYFSGKGTIYGTFLDDVITGSTKNDTYYLTQGGNDYIIDKDGNDKYNATVSTALVIKDKAGKDTYSINVDSSCSSNIADSKGNDKYVQNIGNSGSSYITDSSGTDKYSIYNEGTLAISDKNDSDRYNITTMNSCSISEAKGNDKYAMVIQGYAAIADKTGDDTYSTTIYSGSEVYITDKGGRDKYTTTISENSTESITDTTGDETYKMSVEGSAVVYDKKGDDKYTASVSGTLNITDKGGRDKYTIASYSGSTNITDSTGDETYKFIGSGGTIYSYDKKGNDKYTIKSGAHVTLVDTNGNDNYTIYIMDSNFIEINDTKGGSDKLTFKNINKNSLIFCVNINREGQIENGNILISAANYNGGYSTVEIDNYFKVNAYNNLANKGAGLIETISASNGKITYNASVANRNIDIIKASVASWLSGTDYANTAEVFESGNTEDIASLIAAYNP